MSKFTNSLETLLKKINQLAGKELTRSDAWLKDPNKHQNYTQNALQSFWNIAYLFHQGCTHVLGKASLAGEINTLPAFFDFFEPKQGDKESEEDGTLRIIDGTTYQLGLALKEFFPIAIAEKDAQNLVGERGLTNFKRILKALTKRLQQYEAAAQIALTDYTAQLKQALNPEYPLPDFMVIQNDSWSYRLELVQLADPNEQAKAHQQAYANLISQLSTYAAETRQKEQALHQQIAQFDAQYPFPKAAEGLEAPFTAAKQEALIQLKEQLQRLHDSNATTQDLLSKAKRAYQEISLQLAQASQEAQQSILDELNQNTSNLRQKADASLRIYQSQQQNCMTIASFADLQAQIKSLLPQKRALADGIDVLVKYEAAMNALTTDLPKKHILEKRPTFDIPDAQKLAPYFDEDTLQTLTPLCANVITISRKNAAERALSSTDKDLKTIGMLQSYIRTQIEKMQGQHQALIQTMKSILTDQNKHTTLPFVELQSRQNALEHRQAILTYDMTEFEFQLVAIQPSQQSLTTLLDRLDSLTPQEALADLQQHQEVVRHLREWFNVKKTPKHPSHSELFVRLSSAYKAQQTELRALDQLLTETQMPLQAKQTILKQQYQPLATRLTTIETTYQRLKEQLDTLLNKEKMLYQQQLTAITHYCQTLDESIQRKDVNQAKTQEDIASQLSMLEACETFFIHLEGHNTQAEEQQIQTCREKLQFLQLKLQQQVKTPPLSLSLSMLKKEYFTTSVINQIEVPGGVFGAYLKERAETFWLKDSLSQWAACLLGCLGYQTEQELRTHYVAKLEQAMSQEDLDTLDTLIKEGLISFKPRSAVSPAYEKSLHAKLTQLQSQLQTIHAQSIENVEQIAPKL